jgi:hypothetical protein
MTRGALLLMSCLGCNTYFEVPIGLYEQAIHAPDPDHVAVRAFLQKGVCGLTNDRAAVFVNPHKVGILPAVLRHQHCVEVSNLPLAVGFPLLVVCAPLFVIGMRAKGKGRMLMILGIFAYPALILTGVGAYQFFRPPAQVKPDRPEYHYYDCPRPAAAAICPEGCLC